MNQYRCETCKFFFRNFIDSNKEIWNKCNIGNLQIDVNRGILIERVGCSSHSDAKTIQCTVCGSEATHPHCDICFGLAMAMHRLDEREKVLDTLIAFLDNADNISDSGNAQKWVSLPKLFIKIEELRHGNGQGGEQR